VRQLVEDPCQIDLPDVTLLRVCSDTTTQRRGDRLHVDIDQRDAAVSRLQDIETYIVQMSGAQETERLPFIRKSLR
jgi:hypothetical protein